MTQFHASGIPELVFGRDRFETLPELALQFGTDVLIVGDAFLDDHPSLLKEVNDKLTRNGLEVTHVFAKGKRTLKASKEIETQFNPATIDCVVSIGGGRAIDSAKLIARGIPHIAVPTTAGTGAPMNGVIFGGENAFQETRQSALTPTMVLADPAFIDEMDRDDFSARALGVLMLLMEAYTSPRASVLSDAVVWSGLEAFATGFVDGVEGRIEGRDQVFYASLMAGVGSAQAGFGLTHRLGAVIEQTTELSYAQACATLCAEITEVQIQTLSDRLPDHGAMDKYAMIGELLGGRPFEDREEAYASLVGTLRRWVARLEVAKIPLSEKELKSVSQIVMNDWQDDVLPIRLFEAEILQALLRRCARA